MQARTIRKQAYVEKARTELAELEAKGLMCSGHAFAALLFVKGELSEQEREGEALLSGEDGFALRAALSALGYAPEDWACMSPLRLDGKTISAELFRQAISTLDPQTIVCLDAPAAQAVRDAYSKELAELESFDVAMLEPGCIASVLGMRVLALGGFAASLENPKTKQQMWAWLKSIPPLGEPF